MQQLTQSGYFKTEGSAMQYSTYETVQKYIAMCKSGGITPKTLSDTKRLIDVLSSVPEDKRAVIVMMAQAFISGMEAQEQLAAEKAG